MSAAVITAISTGAVGIIAAVVSLITVLRHQSNPDAHGKGQQ